MVEKVRRAPWVVGIWAYRLTMRAWAVLRLVPVALWGRVQTNLRRRTGRPPRLIWGPTPLINIKYWSQAARELGYPSLTCVDEHYDINSREDFERYREDFGPGFPWNPREYRRFAWVLRNADILIGFLDYGYLKKTPLERLEGWLLRLAGKKLVVCPYGGDIAVPGHIGVAEEAVLADYPVLIDVAEETRARVHRVGRWANVTVRNYQFGYLPRWDVLWPTQLAIDLDGREPVADPDSNGEVVVVHAPNHRRIKATSELLEAIGELRAEGVPIRAEVLEGRPNTEVREIIARSDLVADQFIAGYAMFAIEGLAAGKPVLSAMDWMPPDVKETEGIRACPIVDTDRGNLRANLERLATDPGLRVELGREGREFAERFHSYGAVGQGWKAIFDHLWAGAPLPREI